jgi:phospholipase/lecithinase/hemolysin
LIGAGAKNLLIANLPDLSQNPFGLTSPASIQQGLQALSLGFDAALAADLAQVEATNPGVTIDTVDALGLLRRAESDPAQFGLSDVTHEGILSGNPAASGFLFWDDVHPTTAGHALIAAEGFAAVTPEPASLTLLGLGLAGMAGFGWRRRRA